MGQHHRSEPGRGWRTPLTVLAAVGIVATACSDGGGTSKTASKSRVPSTSSTTLVVGKKVAEGTISQVAATTFDVPGTKIKVLIPLGSVSKDATVEVREVQGAPSDLGAVQVGSNVYDVAIKNGKIAAGKQISIQFPIDTSRIGNDDPRPVGGMYDTATGWQPATSDNSQADAITVYATKAGKYSWLHWSWDKAVQTGTDTIRALVGPVTPQPVTLKCEDSDAVRAKFDVVGSTGSALTWCVGKDGGTNVVRVLNNGEAPLAIRSKGFGPPKAPAGNILLDALAKALVAEWQKPVDEEVTVVTPGDEVDFPILDDGSTKALLRAEMNGFTQHFDALGAATAFATGFYAGSAATAVDLLEKDKTIRDAVIAQVTAKGCVNGLGAVTGNSWATKDVATYVGKLVLTCMDAKTTQLVTDAVTKRTSGLRARFTKEPPARTSEQIKPALLTALSPLVEPVGGSVAGEITVAPRGTSGVASATPTLSTVSTQPTVEVTVVPPSTTATTGATANGIVPTTTTLPSSGGPTTRPATTTTTVPATTTAAPTTTVKPTTTTGATTTTLAPTTTTTVAPLNPELLPISGTCGTNGGNLTLNLTKFVKGWNYMVFAWPPGRPPEVSAGLAPVLEASFSIQFPCLGKEPGVWSFLVTESDPAVIASKPLTTGVQNWTVSLMDTRNALVAPPLTNVATKQMCSGGPTAQPGGVLLQTFRVPPAGGPGPAPSFTLTEVGIRNTESFSGSLQILKPGVIDPLWTEAITIDGTDITVAISIPTGQVVAGDLLTLRLTNVSPKVPTNATLAFRHTINGTTDGASLSIVNSCAQLLPVLIPTGEVLGWINGQLSSTLPPPPG